MKNPTCTEIAHDKKLWEEYVDPHSNDPECFDASTEAERLAIIHDIFPEDCNCEN